MEISEEKSSDGLGESDVSDKDEDEGNGIKFAKDHQLENVDVKNLALMIPEPYWIN